MDASRDRGPTYPAAATPYLLLIGLTIAEVTAAFETTMVYASMKTLIQLYKDPISVGWLITGYLLVSAAAAAICGRLGDIYGRRRMLLIVLFCALAGSLISMLATDLAWTIVGRCVQGFAGSILPLCYGIVRERLPLRKVPLGIGVLAAVATVAAGLGLVVGGLVVDHGDWRHIFTVSAACAAVSIAVVWMTVPASPQTERSGPLDLVGGLLFVPAIAALLLCLSYGDDWGWGSRPTLLLAFGGVGILAYWIRHELRQSHPLIDVRLFANRSVALSNLSMALVAIGAMQAGQVLSILFQQPLWTGVGFGLGAAIASTFQFPSHVIGMFFSPLSGHLSGRYGGRYAALWGAGLLTVGWSMIALYHDNMYFTAAAMLICGAGISMQYAAAPNVIVAAVPASRTSEAAGMMSVIRAAGQASGAQMVVFLMSTSSVSAPEHGAAAFPGADAYLLTFTYVALSCAAALAATYALPRMRLAAA